VLAVESWSLSIVTFSLQAIHVKPLEHPTIIMIFRTRLSVPHYKITTNKVNDSQKMCSSIKF